MQIADADATADHTQVCMDSVRSDLGRWLYHSHTHAGVSCTLFLSSTKIYSENLMLSSPEERTKWGKTLAWCLLEGSLLFFFLYSQGYKSLKLLHYSCPKSVSDNAFCRLDWLYAALAPRFPLNISSFFAVFLHFLITKGQGESQLCTQEFLGRWNNPKPSFKFLTCGHVHGSLWSTL